MNISTTLNARKIILAILTLLAISTGLNAQTFDWAKQTGGTAADQGLSVSSNGIDTYTTGTFNGTTDFDPGGGTAYLSTQGGYDIFIQKLDVNGNFLWAKSIGGTSTDIGRIINNYGTHVVISGTFNGTVDFDPGMGVQSRTSNGGSDIFVLVLDGSGNFMWVNTFGGTANESIGGQEKDALNYIVITGGFINAMQVPLGGGGVSNLTATGGASTDVYVVKMVLNTGWINWAKSFGGSSIDLGSALTIKANKNILISGSFRNTIDANPGAGNFPLSAGSNSDVFIVELDDFGVFIDAVSFTNTNDMGAYDIELDANENIYLTGPFKATTDFDPKAGVTNITSNGDQDCYVVKLTPTKDLIWAKTFGGTGLDQPFGIELAANGDVYTAGRFSGTVDFDPNSGSSNHAAVGGQDIFINKLNAAGDFQLVHTFGNTGNDMARGLDIDVNGNMYVTGIFEGAIDFDPTPGTSFLSAAGSSDKFLMKYLNVNAINISSITVTSPVATITTNGGTLQMGATVLPANATNGTYTWSVANGTGSATISTGGLLTATANGTVTVTATANEGSGTVGTKIITLSNQITLVSSINVQGQGGASTITTFGGTLQMGATVSPANATNGTYTWSVANGTGSATISTGGLLTATANGTVTVSATANDGSGITGTKTITLSNQILLVNAITVNGQGGSSTITTNGGTLQMQVTVLPTNATNGTYTFSIANGTGTATLSAGGLLTAITNGTVTITATANDASGVTGAKVITISNQACVVTIPDANFKAYLVGNSAINTNGDTEIQCTEASSYSNDIQLSNLNISDLTGIEAFTSLTELFCENNNITTIDVSANTALTFLRCSQNSIATLDISNNIALTDLECTDNLISSLTVSTNVNLNKLKCGNNSISSLDLSNNTSLALLYCSNNTLTSLNIANGNNTNVSVFNFYSNNNPNLTCITVDDVAYSTTNWTNIDAASNFSTNCNAPVLVNSITVQGQTGTTTITTQGGTLQMNATVLPANADDATYTWSVMDGSGTATIDANGLLTALTDGTVTVIAAANDASNTAGTKTITISNQTTTGINEVALQKVNIYPNPVKNQLFIELDNQEVTEITIIDYSGRVVKTINENVNSVTVSDLTQGIYILKVATKNGVYTHPFVKE